jgi:Late competence development protein ComFB
LTSEFSEAYFFPVNLTDKFGDYFQEVNPMTTLLPDKISRYCNVLEPLVTAEVMRQLAELPPNLVKYIKPEEAIAYALNRLPPLYATSQEGWKRQQEKAQTDLAENIFIAVRQGLAAVQRDPLKASTPLEDELSFEQK